MPWKGIVHSNATVANLIRKAEIRVLPAVIVVDDKVIFLLYLRRYSKQFCTCGSRTDFALVRL